MKIFVLLGLCAVFVASEATSKCSQLQRYNSNMYLSSAVHNSLNDEILEYIIGT